MSLAIAWSGYRADLSFSSNCLEYVYAFVTQIWTSAKTPKSLGSPSDLREAFDFNSSGGPNKSRLSLDTNPLLAAAAVTTSSPQQVPSPSHQSGDFQPLIMPYSLPPSYTGRSDSYTLYIQSPYSSGNQECNSIVMGSGIVFSLSKNFERGSRLQTNFAVPSMRKRICTCPQRLYCCSRDRLEGKGDWASRKPLYLWRDGDFDSHAKEANLWARSSTYGGWKSSSIPCRSVTSCSSIIFLDCKALQVSQDNHRHS